MEKKFDKIKYQNEFNKANYDRIEIVVPKGKKAELKEIIKASGQSMSEYINQAINERIEKEITLSQMSRKNEI